MKRKEERERKAKIRSDQYSHPAEWNDCYHHWIEGAEWADRTMLDKVCEYLKKLAYQEYPGGPLVRRIDDEELKDLRKAMEE